ncbi:hypothetical protein CAAN1_24S01244 [[Candida] anglica]|uniref:Uncharacterized protein n=1 Tax=[Candida] anglica TaxID=148631 RepID=A0ABP0EDL9_9ASCO
MFIYLVVAVIIIAVVILLPYSTGLTSFEKNKRTKKSGHSSNGSATSGQEQIYGGYVPPDEANALYNQEHTSTSLRDRAAALKERINVTSDDIPVRIRLSDSQAGLRKRGTKEKLDTDINPNNYDYDLDELIEEEQNKAQEEQRKEFYKKESVLGGDKETMV